MSYMEHPGKDFLAFQKAKQLRASESFKEPSSTDAPSPPLKGLNLVIEATRLLLKKKGRQVTREEIIERYVWLFFRVLGNREPSLPSIQFLKKKAKFIPHFFLEDDPLFLDGIMHVGLLESIVKAEDLPEYQDEVKGISEFLSEEMMIRREASSVSE